MDKSNIKIAKTIRIQRYIAVFALLDWEDIMLDSNNLTFQIGKNHSLIVESSAGAVCQVHKEFIA